MFEGDVGKFFFLLFLYPLAFESNRLPGTGGRQMFVSLQSSTSSSRKQQTISAMGQSQQEMLHSGRLVLQLEGGGECPHPELAPALDVSSVGAMECSMILQSRFFQRQI
ncbi:hypothetical protein TWF173_001966 [Orbilia oligospora]|nr:hypothetical protein TWF173_001966 [Orbilia oligospora]